MKKIISIAALIFMLALTVMVPVSATNSYQTYIYSNSGFPLYSPDAYVPYRVVDSAYMNLDKEPIEDPRDIVVDSDQNVYIADMKTNRIVVLDKYYKHKFTIKGFINNYGVEDELTGPKGVFVSERTVNKKDENGNVIYVDGKPVREEEKLIYVCDTGANRLVVFDENGEFVKIIPQPEDQLFEEGSVYTPEAVAVDSYGRIYVVSSTNYEGIIMMTSEGEFTGFIGAQKTALSAWEIIVRMFRTEEMKKTTETNIPMAFNNIDIDTEGFIYATIYDSDMESKFASAIRSKSKAGDYAPVKMLNGAGEEIMRRNGFYPPSGEIQFTGSVTSKDNNMTGPSKVIDVAVGPERTWSIIDEKRSKIFTYDFDGNLLFAFGDVGSQLGNIQSIQGLCYQGTNLLVLDKSTKTFTVFTRTEYGDTILQAIQHENDRLFHLSKADWEEVLKRNSNFDDAYVGIGQALYQEQRYEESLVYYKAAYDTQNYSKSYQEIRKLWIQDNFIWIPIVVIAICLLVGWFFKWANKVNREGIAQRKKTFKEELLYGFHLIFHPFDGFWDLKHEKRGSIRASIVYLLLAVVAFFYQAIGESYLANPQAAGTTIVVQFVGVFVPLMLWVVANWCLTTLFDGEGSMKDIFIASCYSLLPLIIIIIPATIVTNILTLPEMNIVSMLETFAFIWLGLLIFIGAMVTHDYTVPKNIITCAATIVGMVFIMFIGLLFSTLLSDIVGFVSNIVLEINYRL